MDKLERKLKSLAEQVELWGLSKEEVVRFIKDLIPLHKISFTDIYPALGENFSRLKSLLTEAQKHASAIELKQEIRQETVEKKGESLSMEVLYEGDLRSKQVIAGRMPIGVIIPQLGIVLYWHESEAPLSRRAAGNYVSKLPKGFDWHILRLKEAVGIRNMTSSVNSVLRAIGGDAVGSRNYMLDDDGQSEGIVRYAAPYH